MIKTQFHANLFLTYSTEVTPFLVGFLATPHVSYVFLLSSATNLFLDSKAFAVSLQLICLLHEAYSQE